jgi:Protein of unknown function (DUF3738)
MRKTVLAAIFTISVLLGQPARKRPSFEVASVRPMAADDPNSDFVPRRSGNGITMHNAPLGTMIAWALRRMLQTLLEDRFLLKVHREKRELSAYDLVVAEGGPKLVPAPSRSAKLSIGFGGSSCWAEFRDDGKHLVGKARPWKKWSSC